MSLDVTTVMSSSDPRVTSEFDPPSSCISSVTAATRTVQSLFGADFGPCWGDFYCSHGRIRGRLYVVTNGVLFFSSLLGFERRLCLQYTDISALVLHRTTSIRIEIADYDTYIFRSFHDREKVLQLLVRLKRLAEKKRIRARTISHTVLGRTDYREVDNVAHWEMQQSEYETGTRSFELKPQSSLSFSALHTSFSSSHIDATTDDSQPLPNRRRAVSDSVIQPINAQQQSNRSIVESDNRDGISVQSTLSTIQEAWEEAAQTLATKKEIGIDGLRLNCSLDEFYNHFLQDEALYSFDRYQKETIHDRDVSITRWANDDVRQVTPDPKIHIQSRVLCFTHPIQNNIGLGPSEAKTTRKQRLHRYQHLGITIDNKTVVEGIPAADTFSVDDFWYIKSDGLDGVLLSVKFEINFTKRTMFKNIIEKSVLRETRNWLLGYSTMIREALDNGKEAVVMSKKRSTTASADAAHILCNNTSRLQMILLATICVLVACLIVVILFLHRIFKVITKINDELVALRVIRTALGADKATSAKY